MIDVEIQNYEDKTRIGFIISTSDGSPLSGQDILDAISDVLLHEMGNYPVLERKMDA